MPLSTHAIMTGIKRCTDGQAYICGDRTSLELGLRKVFPRTFNSAQAIEKAAQTSRAALSPFPLRKSYLREPTVCVCAPLPLPLLACATAWFICVFAWATVLFTVDSACFWASAIISATFSV
jgi:hypothetical protein